MMARKKLSLLFATLFVMASALLQSAQAVDTHTIYVAKTDFGSTYIQKYGYPSMTDLGVIATVPGEATGIAYGNNAIYLAVKYGSSLGSDLYKISTTGTTLVYRPDIKACQSASWGENLLARDLEVDPNTGNVILSFTCTGQSIPSGPYGFPHGLIYWTPNLDVDTSGGVNTTAMNDPYPRNLAYTPDNSRYNAIFDQEYTPKFWRNTFEPPAGFYIKNNEIILCANDYTKIHALKLDGSYFDVDRPYNNGSGQGIYTYYDTVYSAVDLFSLPYPTVSGGHDHHMTSEYFYPLLGYGTLCSRVDDSKFWEILPGTDNNLYAVRSDQGVIKIRKSTSQNLGFQDWRGYLKSGNGLPYYVKNSTLFSTVTFTEAKGAETGPDGNFYITQNGSPGVVCIGGPSAGTNAGKLITANCVGDDYLAYRDLVFVPNATTVSGTVVSDTGNCNSNLVGRSYTWKVLSTGENGVGTVNAAGAISFQVTSSGTSDICVKINGALSKKIASVTLSGVTSIGTLSLTLPDILNDDVWDDFDLNEVNGGFGSSVTPGTGADYNCDGVYDDFDLNQINGGFGSTGDCFGI